MTEQEAFNKFYSNILLDVTRKERMESAVTRLAEYVSSHASLKAYYRRQYLQGSVAMKTNVRPPRADTEFDADLVFEFGFPVQSADATYSLVERALKDSADYKSRLDGSKDHCIRLNYAGDFHLDLVIGHKPPMESGKSVSRIQVPVRRDGWINSGPLDSVSWAEKENIRTRNDFSRTVRMLKWWRSRVTTARREMPGIVLTTLISPTLRSVPGEKSTFADSQNIAITFAKLYAWTQQSRQVQKVRNPVYPFDDLARDWTQANYEHFCKQVGLAYVTSNRALSDSSLWRQIFGDQFPTV